MSWISGELESSRWCPANMSRRHVQFFSSPTELLTGHPLMRPKVVLAIPPTMSHGPSRWLFTAMAGTEGNVILLTNRGEDNTLSREIYDAWAAGQDETALWGRGRVGHLQDLSGNMQLEVCDSRPHDMLMLIPTKDGLESPAARGRARSPYGR